MEFVLNPGIEPNPGYLEGIHLAQPVISMKETTLQDRSFSSLLYPSQIPFPLPAEAVTIPRHLCARDFVLLVAMSVFIHYIQNCF